MLFRKKAHSRYFGLFSIINHWIANNVEQAYAFSEMRITMSIPQMKINKILFATDLSENARYAFSYAVSLANLYEAHLIILHVLIEDAALEEKLIGHVGAEQLEEIKRQQVEDARLALIGKQKKSETIRRVLNNFCGSVAGGMGDQPCVCDEIIIQSGDPVEQILALTKNQGCDIIVIGSHGHGPLSDKPIGSTAERVLRRSRTPVLMVRLPDESVG